jgi:hypothetical protein
MGVFRFNEFKSDPFGHGAEKRTSQISFILDQAGLNFSFLTSKDIPEINFPDFIKNLFKHIILIWSIFRMSEFKTFAQFAKIVTKAIRTKLLFDNCFNTEKHLLLWEFTRSNYFYIPKLASGYNVKTVAIPQNIESLVPNQGSAISGKKAPKWFSEEVKYLSQCDITFCISREDAFILSAFGINAAYLPYYPVPEVESKLLQIRSKRVAKIKDDNHDNEILKILMLGSADNQPTRLGMQNRIDFFRKYPGKYLLLIAGFHTEIFKTYVNGKERIKLLGELAQDELEDLLVDIDLILVHQPPTSGALTRIPEMLIAGIPVYANFAGARNSYDIEGVYTYNDDDELLDLFETRPSLPPVPKSPEKEMAFFLKQLSKAEH